MAWGWEGDEEVPTGSSEVTITLKPADGGTSLTLVHSGLGGEQEAKHAEGWNHYLGRLVALAETGDAGPDAWGEPQDLDQLKAAEAGWAALSRILAAVGPDDRGRQTPCEDFDVAALTEHLSASISGIGSALGAPLPEDDGDAPSEARVGALIEPTLEAFGRRGLEGEIDMGFAVLPAALVANILNLELLVHAWDYATALGRVLDVPAGLSDYVLGLAQTTISDQIRANGSFGPQQLVEESAHALDRLVAFTGRFLPVVDVQVSTTIRRARAEVAAYAADPETAPEWYQNIVASAYRTPKPLAVGSEVDFTAKFAGRTLNYTYRIEEYVPAERLVMATAEGPFPMRTTYGWADTAGGTLMTLRNEGGPKGIAALADPFMALMVKRTTRKELQRLKAILESLG